MGHEVRRPVHYTSHHELPLETQKYFHQRHDIFSKYDESEGVFMTDDAWFGVTPETIADNIAYHIEQFAPANKTVLIDAFAGVGGNTIAFAKSKRWDRVFGIEKDQVTLECAKRNAKLYGVENKIWWILGDCFDVLQNRLFSLSENAIVFASPPWGGPGYGRDVVFNLESMEPYSLKSICNSFLGTTELVVLYLPRTSDLTQVAKYQQRPGRRIPVIHYCLKGASRAMCVFLGPFSYREDTVLEK